MHVYKYGIGGLSLTTGDLICTTDGGGDFPAGQFWRLIGGFIPGPVDHIVIYIGPNGRCVEAGARGKVVAFEARERSWNSAEMADQRGPFRDELYGAAYPLAGVDKTKEDSNRIRMRVAQYCLAQMGKTVQPQLFELGYRLRLLLQSTGL